MKHLIYAVDDEESIRELYACALSPIFDTACFCDGKAFYDALSSEKRKPDLVLLDVMLENEDGFSILTGLRQTPAYREIPVIMVSAKGEEINKVKGLNLGADDYIAKPFGVMELIARINANLRRVNAALLTLGRLKLDEARHAVTVDGNDIKTTLKEYELLRLLLKNAGKVVPREKILASVWGDDYVGETRTLDIHLSMLRRALDGSGVSIETVRGVGYMLK